MQGGGRGRMRTMWLQARNVREMFAALAFRAGNISTGTHGIPPLTAYLGCVFALFISHCTNIARSREVKQAFYEQVVGGSRRCRQKHQQSAGWRENDSNEHSGETSGWQPVPRNVVQTSRKHYGLAAAALLSRMKPDAGSLLRTAAISRIAFATSSTRAFCLACVLLSQPLLITLPSDGATGCLGDKTEIRTIKLRSPRTLD